MRTSGRISRGHSRGQIVMCRGHLFRGGFRMQVLTLWQSNFSLSVCFWSGVTYLGLPLVRFSSTNRGDVRVGMCQRKTYFAWNVGRFNGRTNRTQGFSRNKPTLHSNSPETHSFLTHANCMTPTSRSVHGSVWPHASRVIIFSTPWLQDPEELDSDLQSTLECQLRDPEQRSATSSFHTTCVLDGLNSQKVQCSSFRREYIVE